MASASAPSKRTRAPLAGNQSVTCLVDGCKSDLSKCRDYHRRHKVCELHSKTPKVSIGGQEQRFCQQCSRFHSLVEFDEGKRSCRKRLDGHNRRRRKPRPDTLPISSGKFLSHCQGGGRYLTFGGGETYIGNGVVNDCVYYNSHPQLGFMSKQDEICGSASQSYTGKHLAFLQVTNQTLPEVSTCDLRDPAMSSRASGATCQEMCFDGLNQLTDSNGAGGALSLLSSPLDENRYSGLSSIFHNGLFPSAHSSIPELNRFDSNALAQHDRTFLVSGGRSTANPHCQEMFQVDSESSSASGHHPTLAFSWD